MRKRPLAKLQDYPQIWERVYRFTAFWFRLLDPVWRRVGYERVARVMVPLEIVTKKPLFGCQMCGQCTLHSTGMTCPMTCPKNLRNGPCGGVRPNGHCEVYPEMPCVWVQAYERSLRMPIYGPDIHHIQPPLDRRLEGSSAWVNWVSGRAQNLGIVWGDDG